jgi:hypothetical protein
VNPTLIVVAIIAGVVSITGAIIGVTQNHGRLRRLERVVALMKDVDDEEARARLAKVRDRLITWLEPAPDAYWMLVLGGWAFVLGIVPFMVGVVFVALRYIWADGFVLGQILIFIGGPLSLIGGGVVIVGVVWAIVTVRLERRAQRKAMAKAAAAEAEAAAEREDAARRRRWPFGRRRE